MEKIARVGIVGGGLAGLAAAVSLVDKNIDVELFDANEVLGGRSCHGSESVTEEFAESCQQWGTGSDFNLSQLLSQVGAAKEWELHSRLHLYTSEGKRSDLYAIPGLPAPLHLAPSLFRFGFLSLRERWGIFQCLRELAKPISQEDEDLSILRWLRLHDQTPKAIDRFWATFLVGSLGTSLDKASLAIARKLMLDRFLLHHANFGVRIPKKSMRQSLAAFTEEWLEKNGAKLHRASPVRMVLGSLDRCHGILLADGANYPFDVVVVSVPWWSLSKVLSESLRQAVPEIRLLEAESPTSVTAAHLWFDRPLSPLAHMILVEGLIQCVFRRHPRAAADNRNSSGFYYQSILDPSRNVQNQTSEEIIAEVQRDLARIWPASKDAVLLRSRLTTDSKARFPSNSEFEKWRPRQVTSVPNLMLAGDWTQTGRPSTLEGAVRSGFLAAEGVLKYLGCPANLLAPEPEPDWLARWLFQL